MAFKDKEDLDFLLRVCPQARMWLLTYLYVRTFNTIIRVLSENEEGLKNEIQ